MDVKCVNVGDLAEMTRAVSDKINIALHAIIEVNLLPEKSHDYFWGEHFKIFVACACFAGGKPERDIIHQGFSYRVDLHSKSFQRLDAAELSGPAGHVDA